MCRGQAEETVSEKPLPSSSESSEEPERRSPSKLYEAVSGYLKGFRGKPRENKEDAGERVRFKTPSGKRSADDEKERLKVFENEKARAERLIQRREWDLAVRSLERALRAASTQASAPDRDSLRDKLQEARAKASTIPAREVSESGQVTNSIGMKLVLIPAGTFVMGSSSAEARSLENEWNVDSERLDPEQPAHTVKITTPFFLGKYEVTVGQFRQFVNETGYRTVAEKQRWGWVYDDRKKHWVKKSGASWNSPEATVLDEDHPVTLICYEDAQAFCRWLSSKENRPYFLPTEAQWEYAARGGGDGERFPWGDDYPDAGKLNLADRRSPVPWADRTIDDGYTGTAPVGNFAPNGFWLYDMAGNVWELCSDNYGSKTYEKEASGVVKDPRGPKRGKKKVVRGGNWAFGAGIARNAFRSGIPTDLCADVTGFRVAAGVSAKDEGVDRKTKDRNLKELSARSRVARLIEHVKELSGAGRRLEARKLVEKFIRSNSGDEQFLGKGLELVKKTLDSLIDVTRDRSRQSFVNSLGMDMIRIRAGAFIMGSSQVDIGWAMATLAQGQPVSLENESPFHKVRISRPFFISATEVTVKQFRTFVEETGYVTDAEDAGGGQVYDVDESAFQTKEGSSWKNPGWKIEDSQPVTMVSYNDAQAFVDWLSAKEKLPYKLPTEAQWEYAARGGIPMGQFPWGDSLPDGEKANYADKNTKFEWRDRYADDGYKYVAPVGSYQPNGFGLYDMAGNVLEWVRDHYGENYYGLSPEVDPEGPGHGENRAMKGGEWTFGAVNLRCAFRGWARPELAFSNSGFRVVIDQSLPQRIFYFADDFLTKKWTPGPDHRVVAGAVAREKERLARLEGGRRGGGKGSAGTSAVVPPVKGVRIIDFTPRSDGKKAGLERGDVIVEYYGSRDLTADKLIALTSRSSKNKKKPILVFVRGGYEYSVRVNPGFLGVAVMDTRIRGPFKKPAPRPERTRDKKRKKRSKPLNWT